MIQLKNEKPVSHQKALATTHRNRDAFQLLLLHALGRNEGAAQLYPILSARNMRSLIIAFLRPNASMRLPALPIGHYAIPSEAKNAYELIYNAACGFDKDALLKAIADNSIDTPQVGDGKTPAAQLAFENKTKETEWLISFGADIDFVAEAAAECGRRAYAEDLMARAACMNSVARGASRGGHIAFARELIKQEVDIIQVACGAAEGGLHDFAEELIQQKGRTQPEIGNGKVAHAAAKAGYRDFAEKLMNTYKADINMTAQGAAEGGNFGYADELIERGASLSNVLRYASKAGHCIYADALITRGAKIGQVAAHAFIGGHHTYFKELMTRGATLERMTYHMLACGKDLTPYVDKLIRMGADIDQAAYFAAYFVACSAARYEAAYNTHHYSHPTCEAYKETYIHLREYTSALIKRGAKADHAAKGACKGNRYCYATDLLTEGASPDVIALAAHKNRKLHPQYLQQLRRGGRYRDSNRSIIIALTFLRLSVEERNTKALDHLFRLVAESEYRSIKIVCRELRRCKETCFHFTPQLEKRAYNIAHHMWKKSQSYKEAFQKTSGGFYSQSTILHARSWSPFQDSAPTPDEDNKDHASAPASAEPS